MIPPEIVRWRLEHHFTPAETEWLQAMPLEDRRKQVRTMIERALATGALDPDDVVRPDVYALLDEPFPQTGSPRYSGV